MVYMTEEQPRYCGVIYLDDPETGDAAVDVRTTDAERTIYDAISRGRSLARRLGWETWMGEVVRGQMVPWRPEPGVQLMEWQPDDGPAIRDFDAKEDWAR